MQLSTVTWDIPLDEPPTPTDDPDVQAPYVYDMVYEVYFPEPVDPRAFRQFCRAVGYPWQPIRVELLKRGVALPRRGRPRRVGPPSGKDGNVPVVLSNTHSEEESTVGTFINRQIGLLALLDDAEEVPGEGREGCVQGIGGLLSLKGHETWGRDIELPCKAIACPVCGPKKREGKHDHIITTFAGGLIHAVLLVDKEWEAFHKTFVDRGGTKYHRIPAPDGLWIVLTDADVGELIDEQDVAVVVELIPADGRRTTQSRQWKEKPPPTRWNRVGISPLNAEERAKVYAEEGLNPTRASTIKGLVGAHDVDLPPSDSQDMERLKRRLGIPDDVEIGPDGWPVY